MINKTLYSVFTIFLAMTCVFFMVRMAPGDPIEKILGPEATEVEISKYKQDLGLDLPLTTQYSNYIEGLIKGDLGKSLFSKKSVKSLIQSHFYPTFKIALLSIFISSCVGVCLGLLAGVFKSSPFDSVSRPITTFFLFCMNEYPQRMRWFTRAISIT